MFNIIIILLSLASFSSYPLNNISFINHKKIEYGIYSHKPEDYKIPSMTTDHYFSVWGKQYKKKNLDYIEKFNNSYNYNDQESETNNEKTPKKALLTLEPWPMLGEKLDRELLLNNIANGKYKDIIQDFCLDVEKTSNKEIYVRWGHEMELFATSRYLWASKDSELFVKAYKTWVDTCRLSTNKIKYNWSPAGNKGQEKYYPGDDYVDNIGFGWYSYPAFEWYSYRKILTFNDIMSDKYNRVKIYNKPLIIAEFGIAGNQKEKTIMIDSIANYKKNTGKTLEQTFPLITDIIIFAEDKTESWVEDFIEAPEWGLTKEQIKKIN